MRKFLSLAAALAVTALAWGQTTSAEYADAYARQVGMAGLDGVGVETILNRWIAAFPEESTAYEGRFLYYWTKAQERKVVDKSVTTYLGNRPVFQLADSLGVMHYYFEDTFFNDEYFGMATMAIDKAMELNPENLNFRCEKILALIEYEKDSPDMAKMEVEQMIDSYKSQKDWVFDGEPVTDGVFVDIVQDYCSAFFRISSEKSYSAALELSVRMNKLFPKESVFVDNMGSYYLLAAKDYKKAVKYYKSALKLNPSDELARKHIGIAEKMIAAKKSRKK